MKLSKRIIAILLSAVMVLTVASATAFANGSNDTASINSNTSGPNIVPLPGVDDNIEADPHVHSYKVLKYDDTYHWYECSCGEEDPIGQKTKHSIGTYVTNDYHVKGCYCKYEVPGTKANHVFNKFEDCEDGKHWSVCECKFVNETSTEKHIYTNCADTSCNKCNATRAAAHKYGANYVSAKASLTKDGAISKKCTAGCNGVVKVSTISRIKTVSVASSVSYTGKAVKPKVTVKDAAGKTISSSNYTVKCTSKKVGKATATVTFKNNYSGSKKVTFKIVPKKTSISSLKAGKKSFTVKYKKQTSGSGYEIQYSTSKKFKSAKTAKISKNKTVSKTVKKLKSKKTYYVRVRVVKSSYKSSWSAVKKVKVK